MARTSAATLTVLLLCAGHAAAQDTLTIGQPIDRAIAAGAAHEQFNNGHDYLNWRGTLADGLIALVGTDTTRSSSR